MVRLPLIGMDSQTGRLVKMDQSEHVSTVSQIAGGDKWAKKHGKWHRSALYVQLLAQTEKPQWVTPQTTKYRYRTVI